MKSTIRRISIELANEIERIAEQNKIKLIDASKEVAIEIRKSRNKKVMREIQF